jgi:1,5-anhydro-D-fructose reductase (1,5-anhydro-D-mannitol-forming)
VPERWPLYENVITRFDAAVRGEGSPLASGRDGIASLACALAVRESSQLNGAAVRVNYRCPGASSTETPTSV